MVTAKQKIEHLKKLGISGDFGEALKMYEGKSFNANDSVIKKIFDLSSVLCNEFTSLSSKLEDDRLSAAAAERKSRILDILFPGHGPIFGGGDNLRAIIGLVDIDGMNYINARVDFGSSSLVHLGEYVFLANDIKFGDNLKISTNSCLSKINIKPDTWICAGVKIADGVTVGGQSVVALGSVISKLSNMYDSSIISGNPANSTHKILDNFQSNNKKLDLNRTDDEIKEILKHIKKQGIDGDYSNYVKLLKNKHNNALDPTIARIFALTHNLCSEYNDKFTSELRKQKIIDILFFMHGNNLKVGNNLLFDVMGTVNVGKEVTIGNNVNIAGNIEIGNNVFVCDNVLLQGIGHRVSYLQRRLSKDENGNICEYNVPGFIKIMDRVLLANGTKVAGGNLIKENTQENEIIR